MKRLHFLRRTAAILAGLGLAFSAAAQGQVLNLYSARHYQTDEALYANFTKNTGIRINRVDSDDAGLLARLKAEGSASPADVILLVDAARLWQAEEEGLFQGIKSTLLEQQIPPQLRAAAKPDGIAWFGFSTRARVIVYNKSNVSREDVLNYQDLGAAKNKGRLCTRSGSHPYNLSLFGAMYEHLGEAQTENWLRGMVANMARPPKGGDVDQIRAVASGECGVTISNTYYLARLLRSDKPEDKAAMEKVGIVFPNQSSWGAHLNIAGGAVARHTRNRTAAVQFLEYLSSPAAQAYFANGNNEWPAVSTVKLSNPALEAMGSFKAETLPVAQIGAHRSRVQTLLDRVGYP